MKYLLKMCAILILATGYIDNCKAADADPATELKKTYEQPLKCVLKAKVKIEFQGRNEEFSLFNDANVAQKKEIKFSIEGFNNTKMKLEYDKSIYEFLDDGKFWIKQRKDGKNFVETTEDDSVGFQVKVVQTEDEGKSYSFEGDECIATLENKNNGQVISYKIVIEPNDIEAGTTILGEYKTGNLKFSFVPNE